MAEVLCQEMMPVEHEVTELSMAVKATSESEEIPDEKLLPEHEDILEKIKGDPSCKIHKEFLDSCSKQTVKQVNDAFSSFERGRFNSFIPIQLAEYLPYSPTANKYITACSLYTTGSRILLDYKKTSVDGKEDCDKLQPGFHNYAFGHMTEYALIKLYPPPAQSHDLVNTYLDRRPNDVFAQYFRLSVFLVKELKGNTKYEAHKDKIVKAEMFAEHLRPFSDMKSERTVLISVYYILGAMYAVTDQHERALDSFKKSYKLDKLNYRSLYGMAYSCIVTRQPEKAIKLFQRYLDIAPPCDSQYPNALYQLGICYMLTFKNDSEALKFYEKGLAAEKNLLPCDRCTDSLPAKQYLKVLQTIRK